MYSGSYRYAFATDVAVDEIEASLVLAILAVEGLHGEARARLDASHQFDAEARVCVIDASTEVGRDLNKLFVQFVQREFGHDCFRVERVDRVPNCATAQAAA